MGSVYIGKEINKWFGVKVVVREVVIRYNSGRQRKKSVGFYIAFF